MFTKILSGAAAALLVTTMAIAQKDAEVVRVDADKKQIEIKIGDKTHTVTAADVTLLDAEGHKAELADFTKGDPVEVTFEKDVITKIQLTGEDSLAPAGEGTVVSIDRDKKQIEIMVGDETHTLAAADVKLLDAEGNTAKLADFAKDDAVVVTWKGDKITAIQKA